MTEELARALVTFYITCRSGYADLLAEDLARYPEFAVWPDDTPDAILNGMAGYTGLFYAAERGHVGCMEVLLGKGAEIEAATSRGWTPFWIAAANDHVEALRFLKERGANIEARDEDGTTPLMVAAFNGKDAAARLLIDMGADIWARDAAGKTAAEMDRRTSAADIIGAAQQQEILTKGTRQAIAPAKPAVFKPKTPKI